MRLFIYIFYIVVSPQRQTSLSGENCLLCGHLQVQEKGKNWTKMWVAVTKAEPMVLYLQTSGQVRVQHTLLGDMCVFICPAVTKFTTFFSFNYFTLISHLL